MSKLIRRESKKMIARVNIKKVLVIYTGGTIGVTNFDSATGYAPTDFENFKNLLQNDPRLSCASEGTENMFKLPNTSSEPWKVYYEVRETQTLCDSTNISVSCWVDIGKMIEANYSDYHGFVILHGTDTMAYTASALSFMLTNLNKSVILTGAQLPLFNPRSDGVRNFYNSIILAAYYTVPEVTICFNEKLLRGNRATKASAIDFSAFFAHDCFPLASIGVEISVNNNHILPCKAGKLEVFENMSENVAVIKVYPQINFQCIDAFLNSNVKGIVLESFGTGNFPTDKDALDTLRKAVSKGVLIVNCSQCSRKYISDVYETGQALTEIGVISGKDMTIEAAFTKLSRVLGEEGLTYEDRVEMMLTNFCGEMMDSLGSFP